MKNIVIACDYAFIDGGAAKVAIQTAVALSKYTKFNIFFLGGNGNPCKELLDSNVKTISLNKPDLLTNPSKINAFFSGIFNQDVYNFTRNLLKELGPGETIIHIHTWTKVLTSAVFKAASDLNVPIFLTVHDYFLVCPNGGCYNYVKNKICERKPMSLSCLLCNCDSRNYIYKLWRYLRQIVQNRVLGRIDIHYIYISSFQKDQIQRRSNTHAGETIIENPISVNRRFRIEAEKNSLYLFIGRVDKEKGVDLFCEAVTQCNVNAVVIGDGKLKYELQKKYANIFFTGWLKPENITEWVQKARCLIFPSVLYEGSPLTTVEVQAYGIPCVVTDCNAAVDSIIPNESGTITHPTTEDLIKGIHLLFDDNYVQKLSINTYNNFDESRCSEKIYANKLLAHYLKNQKFELSHK